MSRIELLKEKIIDTVGRKFSIESCDLNDLENFSYPRLIEIFKFNTVQYRIGGLGNMGILETTSIIGMNLLTAIFTPEVGMDIPLVIIDFVEVKDKLTVFVEFFTNHIVDKNKIKVLENKLIKKSDEYKEIENYIEKYNWYVPLRASYSPLKKGNKSNKDILEKMIIDYLDEYLSYVGIVKQDSKLIKNVKLAEFIDDLIVKGNPSTSILNKALGKEKAEQFFRKVIFYY